MCDTNTETEKPADKGPKSKDSDGDGVDDSDDNCPNDGSSADQTDADGDGAGDLCDVCPGDGDNDAEGDGVCVGAAFNAPATAGNDNCQFMANPAQVNLDAGTGDVDGDACDADADGDLDNSLFAAQLTLNTGGPGTAGGDCSDQDPEINSLRAEDPATPGDDNCNPSDDSANATLDITLLTVTVNGGPVDPVLFAPFMRLSEPFRARSMTQGSRDVSPGPQMRGGRRATVLNSSEAAERTRRSASALVRP